ncbi:MAG: enoyl-CoA hydratase/isomerase family protein, partial [Syntrophomonadaceae bacterium]|nr:enoyl-CoA hydratase/isomerase family protein [Syntrophomonadaceae bacterium]
VIINANEDHFSAGVDLKFLRTVNSEFIMDNLDWLQRLYGRWQEMPIPVIAAVHGLCYGSATELILGCDIRIAAKDARISIPEVRFGLSPDMGGTVRLTQLVGMGQAKRLILGCEEVGADEAFAIGLVEIVVEREQLMERAMKLAKRIASMPPAAVRFAKRGINLANESSVMAGLLYEQAQSTYCCGTEDQNEAIDSFFEKRKPVFKNK